jgi:hypothetical protein
MLLEVPAVLVASILIFVLLLAIAIFMIAAFIQGRSRERNELSGKHEDK